VTSEAFKRVAYLRVSVDLCLRSCPRRLWLRRRRVMFEWLSASASARCDASLSLFRDAPCGQFRLSVAAVPRVYTSHCFECHENVLRVNIIPLYRRTVVAAAAAAVVNECSDTAVFARTHRLLWGELLPLAAALKTVADVEITKCHHRYRSR
jgi:hypothetical protein